jgi:SAM-dependent methyltransferase
MVIHNNCILCGSSEIIPFLKCTDKLVSKKEFGLSKCSSCGFIFTADPPSESEIGHYYESDEYISHSDSGRSVLDKTYRFVRKIMLTRKRKLVIAGSRTAKGNILDIGCGTGHFLNAMKMSGWKTTGVEINKKARDHAIKAFGLDVVPPESLGSLRDKDYDCITLWHVLEHFHQPFIYLSEIRRLLKPGGTVLIALPNSDSFDADHYGKNWAAYDVPRHLWHFSPVTFTLFAEKAGLRVTSLKVLPFDVFYISILSEKQKEAKPAFLFGLTMGKIYFLLTLFNRRRGSSIVYTLKG